MVQWAIGKPGLFAPKARTCCTQSDSTRPHLCLCTPFYMGVRGSTVQWPIVAPVCRMHARTHSGGCSGTVANDSMDGFHRPAKDHTFNITRVAAHSIPFTHLPPHFGPTSGCGGRQVGGIKKNYPRVGPQQR